uniref:Myb-like domain-containing protein n=1 Tax=Macrostomum lignano TaxID=282301 RepID=A0A1I8J5J2_9PLAT
SGRGVQPKTADLFLGTEPESRVSTADEDASTDSNDLASVRLKTRKTRQDARNLRARSPVKREFNLKGGEFDATEFLVAHKAADGPLSDGPSRASSPPSPRTLQSERDEAEAAGQADEEGQDLQLGGKGLIAPAHAGPGGEQIDVAALSQDQLMSVLTQHAEDVAENVLKNQRAGQDIAEDVQNAIADLMTQRAISIPSQKRRRAGGGQAGNAATIRQSRRAREAAAAAAAAATATEKATLGSGVDGVGVGGGCRRRIGAGEERELGSLTEEDGDDEAYDEEAEADEELRAQEEEAEFKDAIKTALISAITKTAGDTDASDSGANEDIEMPDEILEMLAAPGSSGLQPTDLVVVIDPQTGRRHQGAAVTQMQATASQSQLSPLSPSQQQEQKTSGGEKSEKQAKPKEAFRVPRVVHKDSVQSVFTGGVSREAAEAAAEPGRKADAKTRRLKPSKKKPAKQAPAAAAEAPKVSEDKKTGKKKAAGKKAAAAAAAAASQKESIAEGPVQQEVEAEARPEEEMSFVRVEEYFSDEDGANRDPTTMMAADDDASAAGNSSSLFPPGTDVGGDDEVEAEFERQLQEQMRRMSVKEQRELRRRADAERRRRETERRRSEAAEKRRRDQEAAERQAQMEQEMEAERLRKEEEVRERRRLEREARERAEAEAEAAERRERLAKDREQRERENFMRKLQEARRLKEEEEERRRYEEMLRQEEEERLRQEEEARLAEMEEQERLEYLRRKAEEEEQRRREEEEERLRQEAEAKKALEEARRLAEELAAVRAAELARRRFQRSLRVEKAGQERYLSVTRAFEFSYFQLLKWIGVDLSKAVNASKAGKA